MKKKDFILGFLYICLLICVSRPVIAQEPQPTAQSILPASDEDLVHFGDLIDVDVVGGFEFDWRGKLNPEGFLDGLDGFSKPVYGLCRSENQIAADVALVYGKILRDPKVVVRIIDRSDRAVVRLEGAVRTPTRFRLRRKAFLREILVLGGGLTDGANGQITIFRPGNVSCTLSAASTLSENKGEVARDNISRTINIKISELLEGKEVANPQVLSGDLIRVLTSDPIYIIGAVNNPRPVYAREQLSLSRVVAIAGGLAKGADAGRVSIFRRDGVETKIIEADLDRIKRGESVDEVLKPFDIIDVAAKGSQRRKYPPVRSRDESRDKTRAELPLKVVE